MSAKKENFKKGISKIIPNATLIHLEIGQLKPSPNNPRGLFDAKPLEDLKESIRIHGVLVPLTVYKLPAQEKYSIIDGERRYRCCKELEAEGVKLQIPANIVDTPDKMASVIYMFNIHSFRESWELMPTALSLKKVISSLSIEDEKELNQITGLSVPQIKRCKTILTYPEKYQNLSLDPDSKKRIPSNFWIELFPVLEMIKKHLPDLYKQETRDGITEKMIDKYKSNKIRSVIHFRKILEAFELNSTQLDQVLAHLREYILKPELETRATFDDLITDPRRTKKVIAICDQYMSDVTKNKIENVIDDKDELINKFKEILKFINDLMETLKGDDAPKQEIEDI